MSYCGAVVIDLSIVRSQWRIMKIQLILWSHEILWCYLMKIHISNGVLCNNGSLWWHDLFILFYSIIALFTFQMVSPFLITPTKAHITSSLPLLKTTPSTFVTRHSPTLGIDPSHNQLPLLSLMSEKGIFCYICSWKHMVCPCELVGWWFRPW